MARVQRAFYEAWLRRDLRADELRAVTDEFIAYHTNKGKDRAGIHEATREFLEYARILREQDGTPRAYTLRHILLEGNYFSAEMQNTTELRLLLEPDPVRVVDSGGKHLMTENDVVALANLAEFSSSGEALRHRQVPPQTIDRLVAELDRAFGNDPKAALMPQFFRETAALWAGIQQHWPALTAEERRQALAYARRGPMARMELRMYAKLLELDKNAAFKHWVDDSISMQLEIFRMEMLYKQVEAEWNN